MHKVEIRFTNEGNQPVANFEVYTEALKDGSYVEMAPMQKVASDNLPLVMFLEADERVIVVAKGNAYRMVFDKGQNANVRLETEEEVARRKEQEAHMDKSRADQAVRAANAEAEGTKTAAAQAQASANANVKKAEADAAKVGQAPTGTLQPGPTSGRILPASHPAQGQTRPGAPASANTGPIDSKQVKKNA
jgi:hypothetical protein